METFWKYTRGILFVLVLTAVCGMGSFWMSQKKLEQMQQDYEKRLSEQVDITIEKQMSAKMTDIKKELTESAMVSTAQNTLRADTIYQVQNYNVQTDTTTTDYTALPDGLLQADREHADTFCQEYMTQMPVEEFLKGLQSMQVISFSPERLVVRKVYDLSKIKYKYYLIASEGEVVVYYGDMKTIYEKTGIATSTLSKEERKALKNGIEVKNEEELFSILENYSS